MMKLLACKLGIWYFALFFNPSPNPSPNGEGGLPSLRYRYVKNGKRSECELPFSKAERACPHFAIDM